MADMIAPAVGCTLTVYDTAGQGLTYGIDSAKLPSPRLQRIELGADTNFNTVT